MDTLDAIYQRRSVKHFDPDHQMPVAELTKLLEAAIQAPTSFNIQHWRFVVVRDPELRHTIRKDFGHDQSQMTDASLLIVMTADVKAWEKEPHRYWSNAPKDV
ncbi:MAG: nitroreductase family protein, partial [Planctomycetota bacterium]